MTALLAQATYRVLDAGQDLRSALAGGLDVGAATDRLAAVVEASMITFDDAVQSFEPSTPTALPTPETVEDLLATAVGQFWVANVALSAGGAVGEDHDTVAPSRDGVEALDAALAGASITAAVLDAPPGRPAIRVRHQIRTTARQSARGSDPAS